MVFPKDFSEATGINSETGKFLSSKTCNILVPTKPVAPTTATFIYAPYVFLLMLSKVK
jgi:hypothetical protein